MSTATRIPLPDASLLRLRLQSEVNVSQDGSTYAEATPLNSLGVSSLPRYLASREGLASLPCARRMAGSSTSYLRARFDRSYGQQDVDVGEAALDMDPEDVGARRETGVTAPPRSCVRARRRCFAGL